MRDVTLGELARSGAVTIGDGYRTKRSEHGQPGYRILRVADINDGAISLTSEDFVSESFAPQIGAKLSQPGDVLLTTKGTVGRVATYPVDAETVVYSPQLCYFRIHDPDVLSLRYLSFWFRSTEFLRQASHHANNTDMAAYINLADIRSISLPLPDISEQSAIADVLGALDDKIAANASSRRVIRQLIRLLFERAVSVGATRMPLMDAVEVEFGEAFKGESFVHVGDGRPLIRIRDLKTFSPQVWTTEYRLRETLVMPGDVVVGMDAEFRATLWLGEPGLLNQRVCRVRARKGGSAFALEALRAPLAAIENEKSATTVIHLNKSDLQRCNVDVPRSEVLDEFEERSKSLVDLVVATAQEDGLLRTTRDTLLQLLMSGRIRVKDAERVAEEVL